MMDPQNLQQELNNSTLSSDTIIEKKKSVQEIFKERVQQWRKAQMKEMTLADQLDLRNPQCVSEFAQEIYENMLGEEAAWMVDPEYL
jgi:hypothetical protein